MKQKFRNAISLSAVFVFLGIVFFYSTGLAFAQKDDLGNKKDTLQDLMECKPEKPCCIGICDDNFDPSIRGSCYTSYEEFQDVLKFHGWTKTTPDGNACNVVPTLPPAYYSITPTNTPTPSNNLTPTITGVHPFTPSPTITGVQISNTQTPTPTLNIPACNSSLWSQWLPACTQENCNSTVQKRTNDCGIEQSQNCSCDIVYPAGNLSWFKTKDGDVHSNKDIMVSIPVLSEKFATYLVTVNNLSAFAAGSNDDAKPDLASEKNWYWYSPPYGVVSYPENSGFFNYYSRIKTSKTKLILSDLTNAKLQSLMGNGTTVPIIEISPPGGNLVVSEELRVNGNKQLVVLVDGDFEVKNNILLKDSAGIIFIIKGNLGIRSEPSETDGVFFVDGKVSTTDKTTDTQLIIRGAIYTSVNGKIFDQSRSVVDVLKPSEIVIFEPKYLVKFSQILGRTFFVWKEVAP